MKGWRFFSFQLNQSTLQSKTPEENRTNLMYNFSSDVILREEYRNFWNSVRIGKLPEDLDALTGTIAVKAGLREFIKNMATGRMLQSATSRVAMKEPALVEPGWQSLRATFE